MVDPSQPGPVSRRQFLAGATVAISGLAGCALPGYGTYDRDQASFDPVHLPYDETYPDRDDVTMFRRGLRRLGYYPDQTVPESVSVNWSLPVNYIGHTAAKSTPMPTPDGETILIPSDTGRLHAVTPDGEHRWAHMTGAGRSLGFHGTPTIVGDTAYLGGYDGDMYAFDVETGDTIWRTTGAQLDGSIAIGSSPAYWEGVIYVVTEYSNPNAGTMWALDAGTGEPLWKDDRLWGMPHPSTAIDPVAERMLTGSNDGVLYAWEFPSLEFEWEFQTGGEIKGTIPTYDGGAFVGSWDGSFYRVDLEDGTEEWSFESGPIIMSNPGIDPDAGIVYIAGNDRHVHALDTDTGERYWSTNVGGSVIGSLTVTADTVLVGSYDSHLYALHKETGEVRWRVQTRGHVTSEPIPRDGRIYYAERADITGHWDESVEEELQAPGHAYCLVADE